MTYQDFKGTFKKASFTEKLGKGMVSDNAEQRGQARAGLENLINSTIGPDTVIAETADNAVLAYTAPLRGYFESLALGSLGFGTNPGGIIDEAMEEFPDKFKENYLRVTPIGIAGNDAHNEIAGRHTVYRGLTDAINQALTGENQKTLNEFSSRTAELMKQDVLMRLDIPGADADANAIGELARLASASYRTSSPQRAIMRAQGVAGNIKKDIESKLPEAGRADYVVRTLNAYVAAGPDGIKQAGRDLYSVIE